MRTVFLVFSFVFINVGLSFSQISIGGGIGYGFPWALNDLPEGNIINFEDATQQITAIKYSLGYGKNYSISAYSKNSGFFEFGCQFTYIDGGQVNLSIKSSSIEVFYKDKGKVLWIAPLVKFKIPKKRFSPFLHFGIGAGLFTQISSEQELISKTMHVEAKKVYSEGIPFCVLSGCGVEYFPNIKNRWHLFLEIRSINATFSPRRSEIVKSRKNGVDDLSTLSIDQKIVKYKKKYVRDINASGDPNKPSIGTRAYYPFSSLGLNIGICLQL